MIPGLPYPPPVCCIVERVRVESTSYCYGDGSGKFTATGTHVRPGVAAVPVGRGIPLGKYILVDGQVFHTEDHIGYGSDLDLWSADCGYGPHPSPNSSLGWGRRVVEVDILGGPPPKRIHHRRVSHTGPNETTGLGIFLSLFAMLLTALYGIWMFFAPSRAASPPERISPPSEDDQ